jgi:hypothetical protein
MRDGDTFRGNWSALISVLAHRDGTSPMRGYYWGCMMKAAANSPDEASSHASTFTVIVILNTPLLLVLQEGVVSLSGGAPVRLEVRSTST